MYLLAPGSDAIPNISAPSPDCHRENQASHKHHLMKLDFVHLRPVERHRQFFQLFGCFVQPVSQIFL